VAAVIVAAVPVKDLVNAKQRLMRVLTPAERSALARAMLCDVLRALRGARLDRVWVVTREPEIAAIAAAMGAQALAEDDNRGHTAAVAFAQAEAARSGATVFVTIPGDVPCVTAGEVRRLAEAAADASAVFVPSHSGLGTNGVALAPPEVMPLRFGEPSFDNHLAAAHARRLAPRTLALPGLALDVDAPEDLRALVATGAQTESGRLVAAWVLDERLRAAGAGVR
jgi:2-phospho-L-lactate/phosphoenolpyruvate guanylyltransferase